MPLRDEYFPRIYRFAFPEGQPLDQSAAIEFSRKGLVAARIHMTGARPMPFYPDKPVVFVLNAENTSSGVVMWKVPRLGTPRRTHFTVTVERIGAQVTVSLAEPWL